ncbi:Fc.00g019950.m01.CDS01 [Cosmosporella sp. VM-42]
MGFRSWVRSISRGLIPSRRSRRAFHPHHHNQPLTLALKQRNISAPINPVSRGMYHNVPTPIFTVPEGAAPINVVPHGTTPPAHHIKPPPNHNRRSGTTRSCSRTNSSSHPVSVEICSEEGMVPEVVSEVLHHVVATFDGIPYAVCDLVAMMHYGLEDAAPSRIALIAPFSSRRIMKAWAAAKGMYNFSDMEDFFGVLTSDGEVRLVHVIFVSSSEFSDNSIVNIGRYHAPVLALSSLANQIASVYVQELVVSAGSGQLILAQNMIWVLEKIAEINQHEHWFTPWRVRDIVRDDFWVPFTLSFPQSVPLFCAAGILVDETGAVRQSE